MPKFMWKDGSKWLDNGRGFWASLIIYNTADGIGSVQQKVGNSWYAYSSATTQFCNFVGLFEGLTVCAICSGRGSASCRISETSG